MLYITHMSIVPMHCSYSKISISLSTSDKCTEHEHLQTLGKRSCSFPLFMRGTKLEPDTFSFKPWREELSASAKIRPLPMFPPSKSAHCSPCQPRGMWPQRNRTMSSAYMSPPQIKTFQTQCACCSFERAFSQRLTNQCWEGYFGNVIGYRLHVTSVTCSCYQLQVLVI